MTHEEILQAAARNQFVLFCGIELKQDTDGSYYTTVNWEEHHHNTYGITHGGLLYTMADTTAGNNARRFADRPVTLDSSFHFIKNTSTGILTAKAEMVQTGRQVMVIRVRITSDTGVKLAEGDFTYFNAAR